MRGIKIAVYSAPGDRSRERLLKGLSELFPVTFSLVATLEQLRGEAALLFGVNRADAVRVARAGLPCLAFIEASQVLAVAVTAEIEFSQASYLPAAFRGRNLPDRVAHPLSKLDLEPGDAVMARKEDEILWIHRLEGGVSLDLAAMNAAEVGEGCYLFQSLLAGQWSRLLPMLHFLREVSREAAWAPPPLRACFMFDDPNLHALSYGHVHYPSLARDAEEHRYHVSFATIPFDSWYVNQRAAALFREKAKYLSLLVHGNNHTTRELAKVPTDAKRLALAAQSLARIERLERAAGLEVPRVMAAPHGACRTETAAVLLQAGYEAACISRGSIMAHNPELPWSLSVGMHPGEFMGGGLPIIPRFGLYKECQTDVLFAAFFGQAIIPVGHHDDLAGGTDLLRQVAALINSMGNVQWMDLKSIARSNFCTRRENSLLRVKMYSRRIHLKVPVDIQEVWIERPWLASGVREPLMVKEGSKGTFLSMDSDQNDPIRVQPGTTVDITSVCPIAIDTSLVMLPGIDLAAIGRRQLCEARDRLHPFLYRVVSRWHGSKTSKPPRVSPSSFAMGSISENRKDD